MKNLKQNSKQLGFSFRKSIKSVFALFFVMAFTVVEAQVGISNVSITPDASSMFEIRSTSKGLLIPRVALTGTTDATTIASAATSLLVYNTATVSDVTPGFYYWSGSAWTRLLSGTIPTSGWALTGNAGTTAGTNFVGTTDAQSLVFKTNNVEGLRLTSAGNLGVANAAPSEKLDVTGNIRFSGAIMPNNDPGVAGKVLSSNGAGVPPTWVGAVMPDQIYSVESSSSLTVTTSWAIIPGESITINSLKAGDRLLLFCSGNALMSTTNYCNVDVAMFVNGAMITIGGYVRFSLDYDVAWIAWQNYSSIARYTIPADGNYTFDIRAVRTAGSGGTVTIGGNSTEAGEGVFEIFLLKN